MKFGKRFCNALNKHIPFKNEDDRNIVNDMIWEMYQNGGALYWDRELFIDCDCSDEAKRDLLRFSDKVHFEPSEDVSEHPGVVVRYKR